ncbi:MAG: hypothetical protein ACRDGN_10565, partial [bacterium]
MSFRGWLSRTFLGFQKLRCPKCSARLLYPLTAGYRVTYWVVLVSMLVGAVDILQQGEVPIPGLLVLGAILALVKDTQIRRRRPSAAVSLGSDPSPVNGAILRLTKHSARGRIARAGSR